MKVYSNIKHDTNVPLILTGKLLKYSTGSLGMLKFDQSYNKILSVLFLTWGQ